jgi:hypothetical protein
MVTYQNSLQSANSDVQDLQSLQAVIIQGQNQVSARARTTQNVIISMTVTAFSLGILLLLVSLIQFVLNNNPVIAAFSTTGGLGTVLGTLLYRPMERAQKSMGDLAQAQIAFLSFNSKVTMWTVFAKAEALRGTDSRLAPEMLKEMNEDIEKAAAKALEQIERYCEPKKKGGSSKQPPKTTSK